MKKTILLVSALVLSGVSFAQVGINNTAPKATLDVTAKNTDGSTAEGFIAPRLTGDQIKLADAKYGVDQNGVLVYATAGVTATPNGKTINITAPGYYYFDGTLNQWVSQSFNANDWHTAGNAGTTAGTNFLGTTDDKSLVFKVNNVTSGYIDSNASLLNNAGFGYRSLSSITTSGGNAAFGDGALALQTAGDKKCSTCPALPTFGANVAIGSKAMASSVGSLFNTAVGSGALNSMVVGANNVAIGTNALGKANGYDTANNTAVGGTALGNLTTGDQNSAFGLGALQNVSTGQLNIGIGDVVGQTLTTGSRNILMGTNVEPSIPAAVGELNIGNLMYGVGLNSTGDNIKMGIGTNAPARKLDVSQAGDGNAFVSSNPNMVRFSSTANSSAVGLQLSAKNATGVDKTIVLGINPNNSTAGSFGIVDALGNDYLTFDIGTRNTYVNTTTATPGNFGIGTQTPANKLQVAGGDATPSVTNATTNNLINAINLSGGSVVSSLTTGLRTARQGINPSYLRPSDGATVGLYSIIATSTVGGTESPAASVLQYFYDTKNTTLAPAGLGNNVGIGTQSPTAKLEITPTEPTTVNPLKLNGLQAGAASDQLLTVDNNGVVKKVAAQTGLDTTNDAWIDSGTSTILRNTDGTARALTLQTAVNDKGYLGLGTNTPGTRIAISSNDGIGGDDINVSSFSNAIDGPALQFTKGRGTVDARQNTANNDILFTMDANAWVNGINQVGTRMQSFYRGNGTNNLTDWKLQTSGVDRIVVLPTGNVGINTGTANSTLQVNGSFSAPIIAPTTGFTGPGAGYPVTAADYTVILAGNATLPPVAGLSGRIITFIDNGVVGGLTIYPAAGQSIIDSNVSNGPNYVLDGTGNKNRVTLQCDGTYWWVISKS